MNSFKEKFSQYLFYLMIFLLPWQSRYIWLDPKLFGETWEYGRISLYAWHVLLLVLLVSLAPELKKEFLLTLKNSRTFVIYFLFVAVTLITSAWAIEALLVTYWAWHLLAGGSLWLIIKSLKPSLAKIFLTLSLTGFIQAAWGVGQFITQATFANKWLGVAAHPVTQAGSSVLLNEAGRWLRAYGGQVHPNVLGGLLVVAALATAWLLVKKYYDRSWQQIFLLSAYLVQLAGLFVTFSRGAWLALWFSLLVWWLANKVDRSKLYLIGLITAGVFVLFGSILWQPTKERLFGSSSRLEQQSLDDRVLEVGESKSLLASAWWHGVGLGNYTKALSEFSPGLRAYRYQPVHNLFLLILTELGIVGLTLFLVFCWRHAREYPQNLWFLLGPIIATCFLDHYWWTSASMLMLFWLIIALPDAKTE